MVEERFADNHGVKIHYIDSAPSRPVGLPILFLPGVVDVATDYTEAISCFGDRRVFVVELRGRGGSDAPLDGYSVPELAGDAAAVLDAAGVGPFHLMTFSRGTTPGLELASRISDRVRSVSIGDYLAAEVALGEDFAEKMYATKWRGTPTSTRTTLHALQGIQAASQAREYWDMLGGLGVPTLIARGGDGGVLSEDRVERYRAAVPDIEVVTIPGAGHDLFRPSRTAYPEAVLAFIARRLPGT